MKRRLRRLGVGLLAVAALAGALWLARDLPRRLVERALAEKVGAKVRIGRLRVRGLHRVVIDGLEIGHLPWLPPVESVGVARVEADGSLWRLARGRCERLSLDGLDVVLAPGPGRMDLSGSVLEADLLEVRGGRVRVRGAGGEADLDLDASIRDVGRSPTGKVSLAGPHLDAASLLALAGGGAASRVGMSLEDVNATLLLQPAGRLRLTAGAARATLRHDDRRLTLDRPRIEAGAVMTPDRLLVELEPSFSGLGPTRAELTIGLAPTRLEHVDARASAVQLEPWLALFPPLPDGVGIAGQAEIEAVGSPASGLRASVAIPSARLATPVGALVAAVRVACTVTGGDEAIHGPVEASVDLMSGGSGWVAALVPARVRVAGEATVTGNPGFSGRLEVATAAAGSMVADGTVTAGDRVALDVGWRWQGGDLPDLAALAAATGALTLPAGVELEGRLAASGSLVGPLPTPAVTATATIERARVQVQGAGAGWSLEVPKATVTLAAKSVARSFALSLPVTTATLRLPPLEPLELSLATDGELDPVSGSVDVHHLELSSPGVGQAGASASFGRSGPLLAHLRIELPDLGRVRSALRPLLAAIPEDLAVKGATSAELVLRWSADGAWSATGPLTLAHAGFASSDGSRVVEDLSGKLDLAATGTGTELHGHATGDAGGFQLLWGTLFGDWSETRAGVELRFDGNRGTGAAVWGWRAQGSIASPGGLHLAATVGGTSGQPLDWSAELAADDLGAVLERSLRPPLAGSVPALETLTAHGAVAANLAGTLGSGGGSARGALRLAGVELAGTAFDVRDLDAEVPVDLAWSRRGPNEPLEVSGGRSVGSLRFAGISFGGVEIPATAASLVVEGDGATLGSSLVLPLFGGRIELGGLSLVDLLRPTRQLETSVRLDALSLAELGRAFGLPSLDGTIDGAFPRVHLTATSLTVDGTGQLALFGGTIEVGHISGKDVLGRYPRLVFDASFSGIDLGRLTRAFDFGQVTGILAGEVHDCELFRGMPVRFSGELRTVRTPGVPQRISVKAVNNVAIVGTGSGIGALTSGLRRFISSYPYEGFGVAMRLEKDHFLLRGLERRGDRELFLRGRFPFRLDVVNVKPGAAVSFRTMVDRLSHLDFSGVRTQP